MPETITYRYNRNTVEMLVNGISIGEANLVVPDGLNNPELVELERLYIYSRWRGNGYGWSLLQEVLEWCREREFQVIQLLALSDNDDALNLYSRAGFTIRKEYDDAGLIHMERRL